MNTANGSLTALWRPSLLPPLKVEQSCRHADMEWNGCPTGNLDFVLESVLQCFVPKTKVTGDILGEPVTILVVEISVSHDLFPLRLIVANQKHKEINSISKAGVSQTLIPLRVRRPSRGTSLMISNGVRIHVGIHHASIEGSERSSSSW